MKWAALVVLGWCASVRAEIVVEKVDDRRSDGCVEVRGVGAGAFEPEIWEKGTVNLVSDVRQPMLEPREGKFRNIYAPSAVEVEGGWRLFFGGWDGTASGNDQIYTLTTSDWRALEDRRPVIEHGAFEHVCNVSALRGEDGRFELMCTAYPDAKGLNKPALFRVGDGAKSLRASAEHLISIRGYEPFASADINGMNVILRERGAWRLYFNNFRDFGKTFLARSEDGKSWTYEGVALEAPLMVNDVKKVRARGQDWYLMALHHNAGDLQYSLSRDGRAFGKPMTLLTSGGVADGYIVAVGWVVQKDRVLGVLYGAGSAGSLDQNRIFARWVQKKVEWVSEDGKRAAPTGALGPDVVRFDVSGKGKFEVLSEDAKTVLGSSARITVMGGETWRIVLKAQE